MPGGPLFRNPLVAYLLNISRGMEPLRPALLGLELTFRAGGESLRFL